MLLSSPPSRTLHPDDHATPAPAPRRRSKKKQDRPHSIEIAALPQGAALSLDDSVSLTHSVSHFAPGGSASMQYAPAGATLPRRKAQAPPTDLYTAIKDYEPHLFSDSGHQSSELPLVEGQVVRILGPPDQSGYYEAEVWKIV